MGKIRVSKLVEAPDLWQLAAQLDLMARNFSAKPGVGCLTSNSVHFWPTSRSSTHTAKHER